MNLKHVLIAATLIFVPASALAGSTRPWVSGTLCGSTYAMEDVNDDIAAINSALVGSGLTMDKVSSGAGFGLSAGLDMGNGWNVGLGFDRLNASSHVGDYSGSIEYDMPASLLRGFGRYSFQSSSKAKGFLEASIGRVATNGTVTISETGVGSVTGDIEGSGLAFELCAGSDFWAAPQLAFSGSLGFRKAQAKDVTVAGLPIFNTSGDDYTIDYSGLFARIGVKVALTP